MPISADPAPIRDLKKAELQVADGVKAAAETEGADMGEFGSSRLMVRLKIKF